MTTEVIYNKDEVRKAYKQKFRYQWQPEKPKGKIVQVVELRFLTSFSRKPFFGESCEKMTVLLDNGRICSHYFNDEYSLWQLYLFN